MVVWDFLSSNSCRAKHSLNLRRKGVHGNKELLSLFLGLFDWCHGPGSHLDVLKQILSSKEGCLDMLKQIGVETCTILDVEKWGLAKYMLISLNWRCVYYHTWIVLIEERPTVTLWNLCGSFYALLSFLTMPFILTPYITHVRTFWYSPHPPTRDHQDHPTNCCRTRLSHFPIWVQSGI